MSLLSHQSVAYYSYQRTKEHLRNKNMTKIINQDGLARLINFQLARLNHTNRIDAAHFIKGMVGAYDQTGEVINKSLDTYFSMTSHDNVTH